MRVAGATVNVQAVLSTGFFALFYGRQIFLLIIISLCVLLAVLTMVCVEVDTSCFSARWPWKNLGNSLGFIAPGLVWKYWLGVFGFWMCSGCNLDSERSLRYRAVSGSSHRYRILSNIVSVWITLVGFGHNFAVQVQPLVWLDGGVLDVPLSCRFRLGSFADFSPPRKNN